MTKQEALYFLEGLAAGIAAPNDPQLVMDLFRFIAHKFEIAPDDMDGVRDEVDGYLDQIEKNGQNGHDV